MEATWLILCMICVLEYEHLDDLIKGVFEILWKVRSGHPKSAYFTQAVCIFVNQTYANVVVCSGESRIFQTGEGEHHPSKVGRQPIIRETFSQKL